MTYNLLFCIAITLFSLASFVACSDKPSLPSNQEEQIDFQPKWWELQDQTRYMFQSGSLVSFTKDSDTGLRMFFRDIYTWTGDAQNILDTTFTLNDFRYILLDYTISDTSSCTVDKMKLYMDGEPIAFDLDSTQDFPQKHFRNTFDFPDFINDHIFKIHFDSEECRNIQMTFNVTMSKEPGTCWMASDIQSNPEYKDSFYKGDLIIGLQPILWYTFGEFLIPDTTYSHCILVKAGMPPDTLRLPLQFTEPSGHDIPEAYLSYHNSEELSNFLGTDSIAQLSCALFYQKWHVHSTPKDTNHYTFSRTLNFPPRRATPPEKEIVRLDSVTFQIITERNLWFSDFIAKYKLKGDDSPYYRKLATTTTSRGSQDIETISISPNDSVSALIDSVSILMIRDSDAESYPIYKDMSFMEDNVRTHYDSIIHFDRDSTGRITETFNRLAETLVKDTTIRSYMILNTIIESPVIETVPDEAIDE